MENQPDLPPPLVILKPKAKRAARPKKQPPPQPIDLDLEAQRSNIRQVEDLVSTQPPSRSPTPEEMPRASKDKSMSMAELLLYGALGAGAAYVGWSVFESLFAEQPRKEEEEQ